jgi:hypothetical protein
VLGRVAGLDAVEIAHSVCDADGCGPGRGTQWHLLEGAALDNPGLHRASPRTPKKVVSTRRLPIHRQWTSALWRFRQRQTRPTG